MRILRTTKHVRNAIADVLRPSYSHRIAAVAFVGADALRFMPSPRGIDVYCWPKAGGTNPHAIEQLRQAGVRVHFVDRLHMKLFSSREGGAVIGSANLTDNALGDNALIELGVRLRSNEVNGIALTENLRTIRDFEGTLRRLHEEHVLFHQRNRATALKPWLAKSLQRAPSFVDWYNAGRSRQPWRLTAFADDATAPRDATTQLKERTGKATYRVFCGVRRRADLSSKEFTLAFNVRVSRRERVSVSLPYWWIPETCVSTSARAWQEYPHLWFAQSRPAAVLTPPFSERDPRFLAALRATVREIGIDVLLEQPARPGRVFLRSLASHYGEVRYRDQRIRRSRADH